MLSEVCQRQPAACDGIARNRPDQGVCWAEAEPETGFCEHWNGRSAEQDAASSDAKKRKLDIAIQARKQQKLLQAEQPSAIECAV